MKMREYIELGPVPCEESCAQTLDDDFTIKNKAECNRFKALLQERYPEANFVIKSFPHDFGTYREVCVTYDEDDEKEVEMVFDIEASCPTTWDGFNKFFSQVDDEDQDPIEADEELAWQIL